MIFLLSPSSLLSTSFATSEFHLPDGSSSSPSLLYQPSTCLWTVQLSSLYQPSICFVDGYREDAKHALTIIIQCKKWSPLLSNLLSDVRFDYWFCTYIRCKKNLLCNAWICVINCYFLSQERCWVQIQHETTQHTKQINYYFYYKTRKTWRIAQCNLTSNHGRQRKRRSNGCYTKLAKGYLTTTWGKKTRSKMGWTKLDNGYLTA